VFSADFRDFLALLDKHQVRYLLIGAFAVAAHGYPRYTKDIDLLIDDEEANAQKLVDALQEFGFSALGLKAADFLEGDIIQLGHEPNRIDLLTRIPGLVFEEAFERRETILIDNVAVLLIAKDDLIKTKLASGRTQDLLDVEKLNHAP
jgi:predicted nucleotidyltransferase